jgi:membrane-bound serine protease (ClpP class)
MESILTAVFFGYILILVEGFIPGGIFGIAGAFCIAVGAYFAHQEFGGFIAPTLTFLIGALGGLIIVFLEFKWLSKSNFGKKLFLSSSTDGVSNKKLPGKEIIGLCMIIGSILWAMVDVWPNTDFTWSVVTFEGPIKELSYAILITIGLVLLLTRILPKTTVWNKLVLSSTVGDATFNNATQGESEPVVGALGKSVSELYPIGQVELEGRRYEARSSLGKISKDVVIKVTGKDDHGLIVVKK